MAIKLQIAEEEMRIEKKKLKERVLQIESLESEQEVITLLYLHYVIHDHLHFHLHLQLLISMKPLMDNKVRGGELVARRGLPNPRSQLPP